MQQILIFTVFCLTLLIKVSAQNTSCNAADPFCTGVTYAFPLATGTTAESGPNYGCLLSQPNPSWFSIMVTQPGDFLINIQSSTGNDLDFACWGPFTSVNSACVAQLTASCGPCPSNSGMSWPNAVYPSGNLVDCSYDPNPVETVHILNTQVGQLYLLMITNYSNSPGNVQFSQANTIGTPGVDYGVAGCGGSLCVVNNLSATPSVCNGLNSYSLTGTIQFTFPPLTGTLIVEQQPSGIQQVFYPPFNSPQVFFFSSLPLAGANHSVTARFSDDPFCTFTKTYTKPTVPLLSFNHVKPTCGQSNGGIVVTISGGQSPYTYTWSTGQITSGSTNTSNLLNNIPSGLYSVTVSDASGCAVSDSMLLADNNAAVVSLAVSQPVTCNNTCTGSLTATVTTQGSPPYNYEWSNGVTSGSTNATSHYVGMLCSGTYTVTLTNSAGCQSIAQAVLNNPPLLTATLQAQNPSCSGSNGQITAQPGGGVPPYNYQWSTLPAQTQQTCINLVSGTYSVTITDAVGCHIIRTTTLTAPATVSVSTSSTGTTCFGGNNGTATVSVGAGVAPFTYNWNSSPPQNTATATGLAAGNYQVTVTSANGCSAIGFVTVGQPSTPISIQVDVLQNASCYGQLDGQVTATASNGTPPYTYSWPGGQQGSSAQLGAGTYTITATDNNQCSTTQAFTVVQPAEIVLVPLQVNPDCNLSNGSAVITVATGGISPYSYHWSTGFSQVNSPSTSSLISNIPAGNYIVTVTNSNGCTNTHIFTLSENGGPIVETTTITPVLCYGDCSASIEAAIIGTPDSPYHYYWSNGADHSGYIQSSDTIHNLCAGIHYVTVTNNSGCATVMSHTVTQPLPFTSDIQLISPVLCNGDCNGVLSVNTSGNNTPPLQYLWSPSMQTGNPASGFCTGTVIVTVTNASGCSTTSTYVMLQPGILQASATATADYCASGGNGTATVTATGGTPPYLYLWNTIPAQSASVATALNTGTYSVSVTDASGCTSDAQATVNDMQGPALNLSIVSIVNNQCYGFAGGSVMTSVSGGYPPYSYVWNTSPPQTSFYAGNLPAGTYTLTVTDSQGCTATVNATVTQPAQNISSFVYGTSQGTVIFVNQSSPGAYFWDFGDGTTSADTNPVHEYFLSGNYNVCLTVYTSCDSAVSCQQVPVVIVGSHPYISEEFSVYPNPACNILYIEAGRNLLPIYNIRLCDNVGRVVYSGKMTGKGHAVDVADLPPGLYFLTVNEKVAKVVIQK